MQFQMLCSSVSRQEVESRVFLFSALYMETAHNFSLTTPQKFPIWDFLKA